MRLDEAIKQLVKIRENLRTYSRPNMARETIDFKQRSIQAIDIILEELSGTEVQHVKTECLDKTSDRSA